MVNMNSAELCDKMKRLRFYGAEKTYYAIEHGYNSRLDELHASILLTKLPHIDDYIKRRRAIADIYDKELAETGLILPYQENYGKHAFYLYVVRHPKRDQIMAKLKENDIFVNISYPWPIHTMTGYQFLGYKEGDLPETEAAAKEIFSLPMYPSLTNEEVIYVCDTMKKIFELL